jgi:Leucine-rich repeat (LRR) protein
MGPAPLIIVADEQIDNARKSGVLIVANRNATEIPDKGAAGYHQSERRPDRSPDLTFSCTLVFALSSTLRLLDLSANRLSSLSPTLGDLTSLRSLFLNQNRLQVLPKQLGRLARLEFFSASYNFLDALPESTSMLDNLRELKLSNNKFTKFPAEVFTLTKLEVLDLSMNLIEEVPCGVGQMRVQK